VPAQGQPALYDESRSVTQARADQPVAAEQEPRRRGLFHRRHRHAGV
jgi:hypothetical protein